MPRRKTNTKPSFVSRLVKFSLLFLLLSILLAWLYQNRLAIAYYFSFQSKHTKQSFQKEVEDARVYQLIKKHQNSLLGIDVSEYQGKIDWKEVDSIDQKVIHFVLVRATAGKDRKDLTFQENWKTLATKKMIRGAYHYYRPNENSLEQANLFIRTVRLKKGDFPPVLDIENLPKTQ
jgi:lysozyme